MILILAGVLSVLVLYTDSAEFVDYGSIKVVHSTEFPFYSDQFFSLYFSSRIGEFPIFSVLVFIIRDGIRVLETGYFYPGFFYELEYPFFGDYLQLLVAKVHTNHSISVRIKFNEISNWRTLEVRYGEFVSRDKMNYAKDNFWMYTMAMYSRTVELLIRTKLTVNTLTTDGRMDGVSALEPGYIVCRGTGGYPRHRVKLTPPYWLNVIGEEYNDVNNEHKMAAKFTVSDHGTRYECYTPDNSVSAIINVFHHPSKLRLEPSYYSTMPNGSSVKCVADDGYPGPRILWHFIRGPLNADLYYNIYENQLFLLLNAPIGSDWIFSCMAENTIPNSRTNSTSLQFAFVVVHSSYAFIITVASSTTVVVIILAIVIVLVVIFRSPRLAARRPATTRKLDAGHRKELAFDPDTAGSLKQSQSTECMHEDVPRYEDINNGSIGPSTPHGDTRNGDSTADKKLSSKDIGGMCYV